MGAFISRIRKEKKLTQKELAEHLHVTDKAVSKWERGMSYPDISMLESIAEILEISVLELLEGERISDDVSIEKEEAQQLLCQSISISDDEINRKHIRSKSIILIAAFFGVLLLNSQMWFAVEIMCLYLIFYLFFSHVKDEKRSIAVIVLIIVGMTALTMLNCRSYELSNWYWGEWWYNTTMLFPIGMIVAEKKDLLRNLAEKHYRILLTISFVGFTIFRLLSNRELHLRGYWTMKMMDKVQAYLLQVPSVIFFVMLLVLILLKVRVGNPLLDFLGKFSLEIILVNGVFLRLFLGIMQTYGLICYLCLTFVGTILSAVLLYKLKRSILELK